MSDYLPKFKSNITEVQIIFAESCIACLSVNSVIGKWINAAKMSASEIEVLVQWCSRMTIIFKYISCSVIWLSVNMNSMTWPDTGNCFTLRWRQNGRNSVSNHQPGHCLLSLLFGRRSRKTLKLRVTGLCVGNSPGPMNSPHKGPVTRKMFPFDDVIMRKLQPWSVR